MPIETVAVTGGSGKIGTWVVRELNREGYETVNLDVRAPDRTRAESFLRTDLLNAGEVYGSLTKADADAVVHMGTLPDPTRSPGFVTFESNAMSSYILLEAATELELEAACLASSVNALGRSFQDEPPEIDYLPVDEDHPATPRDPYALGKRVIEVVADGFGRRQVPPTTVSTLRYPWMGTTEDLREAYTETDRSLSGLRAKYEPRDSPLFDYVHVDDVARAARLALEADYRGHETFWIAAADTNTPVPTAELLEHFYPETETTATFSEHESLITTQKARDVLGWEPEYSWRDA